jgi:hypothetical protein
MTQHVMDTHRERFGWRVWHVDGSRLSPPIHRGRVRFGARVVESVCSHRSDPMELAADCGCGVYFEHRDAAMERWCVEADRVGDGNVALTFGAAVGDVAADPVLPDQALRSPRYAMLGILLPPASPAAGPLRKRYDASVHMREIDPNALKYVEDAVRGDLRHASGAEFFDGLRAESLYPESEHVMDVNPELFGWRVWRFHPDTRALSEPNPRPEEQEHSIVTRRTRSGATYFEAECGPGIFYTSSGYYCGWTISVLEQLYESAGVDVEFAAMFGIATSPVPVEEGADGAYYRSSRFFPMAVCIPAAHAGLKQRMQRVWGFGVFPQMTPQTFNNVEREARRKLAHVGDEALRRTGW